MKATRSGWLSKHSNSHDVGDEILQQSIKLPRCRCRKRENFLRLFFELIKFNLLKLLSLGYFNKQARYESFTSVWVNKRKKIEANLSHCSSPQIYTKRTWHENSRSKRLLWTSHRRHTRRPFGKLILLPGEVKNKFMTSANRKQIEIHFEMRKISCDVCGASGVLEMISKVWCSDCSTKGSRLFQIESILNFVPCYPSKSFAKHHIASKWVLRRLGWNFMEMRCRLTRYMRGVIALRNLLKLFQPNLFFSLIADCAQWIVFGIRFHQNVNPMEAETWRSKASCGTFNLQFWSNSRCSCLIGQGWHSFRSYRASK